MRLLSSVVVGLVLLSPVPAHAQGVTVADIVGTWIGGKVDSTGKLVEAKQVFVFRPDSTFLQTALQTDTTNYTVKGTFSRWHHLRGDTLSLEGGTGVTVTPKPADRQLILTSMGGWGPKGVRFIYTRQDSLTPKP